MNIPKLFATIVMMLTLLITQISGAFTTAEVFSSVSNTSCSMSKAPPHSLHADGETGSTSEYMHSGHDKATIMDCCDNADINNCCDGQCSCFAVAATVAFIVGSLSEGLLPNTNETFIESSPPPHSAFSALLMRPPIQSLA
jgi:hypothetical protein